MVGEGGPSTPSSAAPTSLHTEEVVDGRDERGHDGGVKRESPLIIRGMDRP
jgi:hypothetical protein